LIAWKCQLNSDGTIGHPGYNCYKKKLDPINDHEKIFINAIINESQPTGIIDVPLDSFYEVKEF
jgi:hypothetical protein